VQRPVARRISPLPPPRSVRASSEPVARVTIEDVTMSIEEEAQAQMASRFRELSLNNVRARPQEVLFGGFLPSDRRPRDPNAPPPYSVRDPRANAQQPVGTARQPQNPSSEFIREINNMTTGAATMPRPSVNVAARRYDFRSVELGVEHQLIRIENRQPEASLDVYVDAQVSNLRDNCDILNHRAECIESGLSRTRGDLERIYREVQANITERDEASTARMRRMAEMWGTCHTGLINRIGDQINNEGLRVTQTMDAVTELANEIRVEREARQRDAGLIRMLNQRVVDLENERQAEASRGGRPRSQAQESSNIPQSDPVPPDGRRFGFDNHFQWQDVPERWQQGPAFRPPQGSSQDVRFDRPANRGASLGRMSNIQERPQVQVQNQRSEAELLRAAECAELGLRIAYEPLNDNINYGAGNSVAKLNTLQILKVTYTTENEYEPHLFVRQFESAMKSMFATEEIYISMFKQLVEHPAAQTWNANTSTQTSYTALRQSFLQTMWNEQRQENALNHVRTLTLPNTSSTDMANTALRWLRVVSNVQINEWQMINAIYPRLDRLLRVRVSTEERNDIVLFARRLLEMTKNEEFLDNAQNQSQGQNQTRRRNQANDNWQRNTNNNNGGRVTFDDRRTNSNNRRDNYRSNDRRDDRNRSDTRDTRDTRNNRDTRDNRDNRNTNRDRDTRNRDDRDTRNRDTRDTRNRDDRDARDSRDNRDKRGDSRKRDTDANKSGANKGDNDQRRDRDRRARDGDAGLTKQATAPTPEPDLPYEQYDLVGDAFAQILSRIIESKAKENGSGDDAKKEGKKDVEKIAKKCSMATIREHVRKREFEKKKVILSLGTYELNYGNIRDSHMRRLLREIVGTLKEKGVEDIKILFPMIFPAGKNDRGVTAKRYYAWRRIFEEVCDNESVTLWWSPAAVFIRLIRLEDGRLRFQPDKTGKVIPRDNRLQKKTSGYVPNEAGEKELLFELKKCYNHKFKPKNSVFNSQNLCVETSTNLSAEVVTESDGDYLVTTKESIEKTKAKMPESSRPIAQIIEDLTKMEVKLSPDWQKKVKMVCKAWKNKQGQPMEETSSDEETTKSSDGAPANHHEVAVNQAAADQSSTPESDVIDEKRTDPNTVEPLVRSQIENFDQAKTCVVPLRFADLTLFTQLDSGATPNIMSETCANNLINNYKEKIEFIYLKRVLQCRLANNQVVRTWKKAIVVPLKFGKHKIKVPFFVMPGDNKLLLI
ncbi:unnamed protein product, partial [Allacma fusca]